MTKVRQSATLSRAWDKFDAYLFDIDGTLLNTRDLVHYDGPPTTATPTYLYYSGRGDLAAQLVGAETTPTAANTFRYDPFGELTVAPAGGSQGTSLQQRCRCKALSRDMKSHTAKTWCSMNRRSAAGPPISP